MKKYESKYYKINAPNNKTVHIHIDYDKKDKKIINVFVRIPPLGDELNIMGAIFGAILSDYFQIGGSIDKVLKHLNSAKGSSRIIEDGGEIIETIPNAIAFALKSFKNEVIENKEEKS
jgi:hypothetical protein